MDKVILVLPDGDEINLGSVDSFFDRDSPVDPTSHRIEDILHDIIAGMVCEEEEIVMRLIIKIEMP